MEERIKSSLVKMPWMTSRSSLVLRFECLLVFVITLFIYNRLGGSWVFYLLVLAAIDLSMLGYLINNHIGGLVYNIGHSYILPRLILLGALVVSNDTIMFFALVWNSHISLDRAFGYGLKHETFHLTHLGPIGKTKSAPTD